VPRQHDQPGTSLAGPATISEFLFGSGDTDMVGCGWQVLNGAVERVIRSVEEGEPSAEVPLGLYIVRGENVCVVGLVDEALDASINWTEVKGEPIGTTKH